MTRYALIDRMLANRHRAYSIQDITDALAERLPDFGQQPVSKRCVEKDLAYLQNDSPFDVEIEEYWIDAADKNGHPYRKRCIRYADPTFSIFKPKLTEDEKAVCSSALDAIGSFDGLENFEWLGDLRSRLNLEKHEPIISMSKNLLTNSTLLARLFTVIRLRQCIRLKYHKFQDDRIRYVSVSPYLLKEYNNRWFLIASASDSGRILTFALDRIDDFTADHVAPYIPAPADLPERYEEIVGITFVEDSSLIDIEFWVSDQSKDYILTKPVHDSQITLRGDAEARLRAAWPHLEGGAFFRITCRENYELLRELTSFGPDLIVLTPTPLRDRIARRLRLHYLAYRPLK